MEGIAVEYFPTSIDTGKNEEKSEFHSYISDKNENMHVIHMLIWFIYLKIRILKISVWYVNIMGRH